MFTRKLNKFSTFRVQLSRRKIQSTGNKVDFSTCFSKHDSVFIEKKGSWRRLVVSERSFSPRRITINVKVIPLASPRLGRFEQDLFKDVDETIRIQIHTYIVRGSPLGLLYQLISAVHISRRLSAKYRVEKRRAISADHWPMTARHWHAHSRNSYSRL